jgi:hypothetical protein
LEGKLERPDLVIFSDTGEEPSAIYDGLARDIADCEAAGIPFDVVRAKMTLGEAIIKGPGVFIPALTDSPRGRGRYPFKSCTDRFKLTPIRHHLQALGHKTWTVWLGFTTDEIERVKPAAVNYITNRYPLIEMNLRRGDCEAVLIRNGLPVVKSSCVFCPNHSGAMWRSVKERPVEFARAVQIDRAIRDREPGLKTYVHIDRVPLDEVSIDLTQPSLFGDECESGYCGT